MGASFAIETLALASTGGTHGTWAKNPDLRSRTRSGPASGTCEFRGVWAWGSTFVRYGAIWARGGRFVGGGLRCEP